MRRVIWHPIPKDYQKMHADLKEVLVKLQQAKTQRGLKFGQTRRRNLSQYNPLMWLTYVFTVSGGLLLFLVTIRGPRSPGQIFKPHRTFKNILQLSQTRPKPTHNHTKPAQNHNKPAPPPKKRCTQTRTASGG
jgi:hypothetical protein